MLKELMEYKMEISLVMLFVFIPTIDYLLEDIMVTEIIMNNLFIGLISIVGFIMLFIMVNLVMCKNKL